jgi:putative serine protease PepD
MTDEHPSGRPPGAGRLWTEPREGEEHTQWLATPSVRPQPAQPEPDPPAGPPGRPVWQLVAIGVMLAFVLVGAGVLGASLLHDESSSSSNAALPAAPGSVTPDARSRAIRQIYASASPSVVFIKSQDGASTSSGTGFVVDSDGTIVTNAHVVAGANQVQVRFTDHGASVNAQVLGSDLSSDLAVLRVDSSQAQRLKPLVLADSDNVRVGDLAVAIGYPLGLDRTATSGIVSGLGRDIQAANGFSIDNVIQTDAPINPGNSGGPLLDGAGRVIGINSQIATADGGNGSIGIGFAVPSNTVREVVPRLRAGAVIKRAYLGISSSPSTVGQGAEVAAVISGGPAAQAGLKVGDTVRQVAGRTVRDPDDIATAIEDRKPGVKVDVEVQRAGSNKTLVVTLGTRPASAGGSVQPSLGAGP